MYRVLGIGYTGPNTLPAAVDYTVQASSRQEALSKVKALGFAELNCTALRRTGTDARKLMLYLTRRELTGSRRFESGGSSVSRAWIDELNRMQSGGSLSLDKIFGCISDELPGYPVTHGRPAAARVSHAKPASGG
jgi:hypothetical protein